MTNILPSSPLFLADKIMPPKTQMRRQGPEGPRDHPAARGVKRELVVGEALRLRIAQQLAQTMQRRREDGIPCNHDNQESTKQA